MIDGRDAPAGAARAHDAGVGADAVGRIAGLDVARGLAVLGMFGSHLGAPSELTPDPSTWAALVNGRSSILFATLAGISIALLSGRRRPPTGVDLVRARLRIAVRAAWVFAIGGVLEWLGTPVAVILGVYAVLFVLALPVLRWSPRRLVVTAGIVAVAGPPANVLLGQLLQAGGAESHHLARLVVTGEYPAMLWCAFVLLGLAVGRLDLAAAGVRARLAAAGATAAVLGYGGGWLTTRLLGDGSPSWGPETGFEWSVGEWRASWLAGAEPHSGTTSELVGSSGVALVVVAGCLVLADRLPRLTAPVGAVGALALSVYTAHIVVLWLVLALDPGAADGLEAWLLFAGCAVVAAAGWRAWLERGPLERLLAWSSRRAADVPTAAR